MLNYQRVANVTLEKRPTAAEFRARSLHHCHCNTLIPMFHEPQRKLLHDASSDVGCRGPGLSPVLTMLGLGLGSTILSIITALAALERIFPDVVKLIPDANHGAGRFTYKTWAIFGGKWR